jgi:hypothetical protein
MFHLSNEITIILYAFAPLFSNRVWTHAQLMLIGAILCTGKRTVTSTLKVMGLSTEKKFTNFHRVLNKSKWSSLQGSKILLGLIVRFLPPGWPILIGIDETIERRKGKKIKAKGCYRDAVRSTEKNVVKCFGLKWISMMLIVPVPWSERCWALPFLTVLAPSKLSNTTSGKRHKTTVDWARQMIMQVRRWLPQGTIVVIGDGAYAAVSLALCCAGLSMPVTLVARLRLDAALYDFPKPNPPGKRGPKPKKGKKQPSLATRMQDPSTVWKTIEVRWYDGKKRKLEVFSGISLWYTPKHKPVAIKWVVTRDPAGKLRNEAFFCTNLEATEEQIVSWFILRWNVEVTFEELRAHIGVETQRQWSDLAILRTTPVLFGLFSIVVLIAIQLVKEQPVQILKSAWYQKKQATFSDIIALVRRNIWACKYKNSSAYHDNNLFNDDLVNMLMDLVCYAA